MTARQMHAPFSIPPTGNFRVVHQETWPDHVIQTRFSGLMSNVGSKPLLDEFIGLISPFENLYPIWQLCSQVELDHRTLRGAFVPVCQTLSRHLRTGRPMGRILTCGRGDISGGLV